MSVDTPAWVRDAAFYQIFPDRFAASDRVTKPGAVEPWDTPPTTHGFKGGDLLGIVERLDYLEDLGVNQAPAIVVIGRSEKASLIEGYIDADSLVQVVADAR